MRQIVLAFIFAGVAAAMVLLAGSQGAALAQARGSGATESAIFAGGCFWCTEADFEKVPGVISAVSGYTGGALEKPTYRNHEGHVEAVRVVFDPAKVSYATLVNRYWRTVDPLDDTGQFCDKGSSYRTAVFVNSPAQRRAAEASRTAAQRMLGRPLVTPIRDATRFWPAEREHQDYAKKNPLRYNVYRTGCRRDARLKALWGSAAAH
jgi:peptide-methionine (S)-S-oxide reductase